MVNKNMKRCSTTFIIREMQTKTTMTCHLMLVRMAAIKKYTNNKCWRECREKESFYTAYGMQLGTLTVENSIKFAVKTKYRVAI